MKSVIIDNAALTWNDQGTPVSNFFDDVYFSNENGLEETRYVFLQGNGLPERIEQSSASLFIVAETGFGTGLNFLTLWQSYQQLIDQGGTSPLPRLHFISCEKYPLTHSDLLHAHAHWPELGSYSAQLLAQWPAALPGCQRLIFDQGRVVLDLWLGDISAMLADLTFSVGQKVDAWFLDGFAPAKNPDMWSEALFNTLASTTKVGGTFATFTAAGFVRRGLQQVGFEVKRRKGFGPKREMLVGMNTASLPQYTPTPWYPRPKGYSKEIAIIGGGLASACLCVALLRRGWKITLYSADSAPAANASGNRQGALYPLLHAQDPHLSRFFPAAFTFATRFYRSLPVEFEHDWCGVLQLGWDEKSQHKIQQMLAMGLPESIATAVDSRTASEYAGLPIEHAGVVYPEGGWLSPAELTTTILRWAESQGVTCYWQHEVKHLQQNDDHSWSLIFDPHKELRHSQIILANGHRMSEFSQNSALPIYPVAGQVSHAPTQPLLQNLRTVLCYEGYLTPFSPRYQTHCIGASYRRGVTECCYSDADQHQNLLRLQHCLPHSQWTTHIDVSDQQARVAVRCATRDHLPMVGAVPNYTALAAGYRLHGREDIALSHQEYAPTWEGLYLLGALGSRGICSAPLSAEILAAQLNDEPLPLDQGTLNALQPNRYWIRKLLKGRPIA